MKVIEYFTCENQAHWLERIGLSDWDAGRFLYALLHHNWTPVLIQCVSKRVSSFFGSIINVGVRR